MSMMLSLDSPRWAELQHAYGSASDVPKLLRQLDSLPSSNGRSEPWFSIWSALAHQGDVYSASFAAVPHVIAVIAADPGKASADYFHFPVWVEICRRRKAVSVPADLDTAYVEALAKLPKLVCSAVEFNWSENFLLCALSAIAIGKKSTDLAEAVLEMTPETLIGFRSWLDSR
jgi:hypothetical protein